MIYLSRVPYLEDDTQDENHVRVEWHHSVGISGRTVKIDGLDERYVRFVSRPVGRNDGHYYSTILVHLKPRKRLQGPKLQCKHIDTVKLVAYIEQVKGNREMILTYYHDVDDPLPTPRNLMHAKLLKLVKQGFIQNYWHHKAKTPLNLTPKAYQYMWNTYA